MAEEVVKYAKSGAIATITLNRPDKHNALRTDMARGFGEALASANRDDEVRVIVIEGAGDSFCAGFDFSNGLQHHGVFREEGYDPGMDVYASTSVFAGRIPIYMGMWRGLKPTIAKVHGWRLGVGSEMALCGAGAACRRPHALRHLHSDRSRRERGGHRRRAEGEGFRGRRHGRGP
jgi:enoyl-CoA hydratase